MTEITSVSNPRIKALVRLNRRSERDATGTFPAEGARVVSRAVAAGWRIDQVVVAPSLAGREAFRAADEAAASGAERIELSEAAFRKVAYRQHPDGVLAVVRTPSLELGDLTPPDVPLLLVVEGIEKPGNLGAMLRTADGAGASGVVAADPATDLTNPNVVRASQGALFSMPCAVADVATTRRHLSDAGIAPMAARPGSGVRPWDLDLTGPVALVIGSEHDGLSPAWDDVPAVTIPMSGSADSLNAATAAAILLYEARRQRDGMAPT